MSSHAQIWPKGALSKCVLMHKIHGLLRLSIYFEQMCWMVCRQMPTQLPTSLSILTYIIYVCSINTIKWTSFDKSEMKKIPQNWESLTDWYKSNCSIWWKHLISWIKSLDSSYPLYSVFDSINSCHSAFSPHRAQTKVKTILKWKI